MSTAVLSSSSGFTAVPERNGGFQLLPTAPWSPNPERERTMTDAQRDRFAEFFAVPLPQPERAASTTPRTFRR